MHAHEAWSQIPVARGTIWAVTGPKGSDPPLTLGLRHRLFCIACYFRSRFPCYICRLQGHTPQAQAPDHLREEEQPCEADDMPLGLSLGADDCVNLPFTRSCALPQV